MIKLHWFRTHNPGTWENRGNVHDLPGKLQRFWEEKWTMLLRRRKRAWTSRSDVLAWPVSNSNGFSSFSHIFPMEMIFNGHLGPYLPFFRHFKKVSLRIFQPSGCPALWRSIGQGSAVGGEMYGLIGIFVVYTKVWRLSAWMPRKRAGWTFVDVSSSAEVLKPVFFFFSVLMSIPRSLKIWISPKHRLYWYNMSIQ